MKRLALVLALLTLLPTLSLAADEPADEESDEQEEMVDGESDVEDETAYGVFLFGPVLNPLGFAGGFYSGAGAVVGYLPVSWIGLDLQGEFGARVTSEVHPQWRVSSHFISFLYVARAGVAYTREMNHRGGEREYLGPELYLQLPLTGEVGGVSSVWAAGLFARYDVPLDPDDQAVFLIGLHAEALFAFGSWE